MKRCIICLLIGTALGCHLTLSVQSKVKENPIASTIFQVFTQGK